MKEVQQAEALRLADECDESATHWVHEIDTRFNAAKMLRAQHARIAELEADLEAIGAGGVEPLSKGFVRLSDVLARLEQGFGANSAPVTTIKRHFEMQAHPTQQGLEPIEQRQLAIGQAVERACKELPEGAEIQIYLERGAGTVHMTDWDGNEFDHFDEEHEDFACRINTATDGAIAAEQVAAQAKQGEQANG